MWESKLINLWFLFFFNAGVSSVGLSCGMDVLNLEV